MWNSLLRKAGLTQQQIDDNSTRLDVKSQIKFLDLAATALKDELLGFHLAQSFDLRLMGLLYYVLASSETLLKKRCGTERDTARSSMKASH